MITRACISMNNRCNLSCKYCHFHEKQEYIHEMEMDIFQILDHITAHIESHHLTQFKLGFVGNGEPLLDDVKLREYILYIAEYLKTGKIAAYTITNGTLVDEEKLEFFKEYRVDAGFSIDGIPLLHDRYRCGMHAKVMENIKLFQKVFGRYPSMNCTVGKETLENAEETIGENNKCKSGSWQPDIREALQGSFF